MVVIATWNYVQRKGTIPCISCASDMTGRTRSSVSLLSLFIGAFVGTNISTSELSVLHAGADDEGHTLVGLV